jgi:hypothetical protein
VPLSKASQEQVLRLGVSTLNQLLTFKLETDLLDYISDRDARDFRSFEEEIAHAASIHGAGVLATAADLTRELEPGDEGFFRTDVLLGAHEVGAYIASFPLAAAAASFTFTVLENFGNDVAAITSPSGLDRNKAWHEDVRGFANLGDPVQLKKARAAFGKHFGVSSGDVPEIAARRIVEVKRIRNEFAHDGSRWVSFDSYLEDVLAIICHIVFLVTDERRLSVYPFEDHSGLFTPQT